MKNELQNLVENKPLDAVIIGGGWAGLSSAVELSEAGLRIAVLERSPILGGRARSVPFNGMQVDNGQHLMIGAYETLLQQIEKVGIHEQDVLLRHPLTWEMHSNQQQLKFRLKSGRTPYQRLKTLVAAQGISWSERFELVKSLYQLIFAVQSKTPPQSNVSQLLLEPLCLAAMSTPLNDVDRHVLATVLKKTFRSHHKATDMLLAKKPLSDVYPNPARDYIEQHGNSVLTNTAARGLHIENNHIKGVITPVGLLKTKQVIIATSPSCAVKLLAPHPAFKLVCQQLKQIKPVSITTVYCQYATAPQLSEPMIGLHNKTGHWIFDRSTAQQPDIVGTVITGHGKHDELDNQHLVDEVNQELNDLVDLPELKNSKVIREKFGAFYCEPELDSNRPTTHNALGNCFLAGDYTNTGLPACIEGAMQSGVQAAKAALAASRQDKLECRQVYISR